MPVSKAAVEVGVVGAVGTLLIFNHFMPPVIDVRANQPYDPEIEHAERSALVASTAFLVLLTAFTRKVETFAIIGGAVVVVDYAYKHANAVHPVSGTMQKDMGEQALYPVPDYEDEQGTG